jgi:hypothetical protein
MFAVSFSHEVFRTFAGHQPDAGKSDPQRDDGFRGWDKAAYLTISTGQLPV